MKTSNQNFSQKQLLAALQIIASKTSLACEICRSEAQLYGTHDSVYAFHALDAILESVGALADSVSGENVVGDFQTWLCGPSFNESDAP